MVPPMSGPPEVREGLTVKRYAEVSAHLRHHAREAPEVVLGRLGLTPDAWAAASSAWTQAIDDDVESGDGALVVAYAAAFAETRRRLEAGEASVDEPPRGPPPEPPEPPPPAPADVEPPEPGSPEDPLNETLDAPLHRVKGPALPFTPGVPSIGEKPPDAMPRVNRAPKALTGTADLNLRVIAAAVLPFGQGASRKPASPAAVPSLTLEQYATLSAELSLAPERAAHIRARYLVTSDEAFRALNQQWQERLSADPALSRRFAALREHYRNWLTQKKE
jgi:hypothetical protein